MAMQRQPAFDASPIVVRQARPDDAAACGRICYEAFRKISTDHAFPPDFPTVEVSTGVLSVMFSHPGFYCVVAESEGKIVRSNCLYERSAIAGVGPITVDPTVQNKRLGRTLMQAVLTRSAERGFPGVRLLQAAFHNRSLSLYTKLGFDTREQYPRCKARLLSSRLRAIACARLAPQIWTSATDFVDSYMDTTAAARSVTQSSKAQRLLPSEKTES